MTGTEQQHRGDAASDRPPYVPPGVSLSGPDYEADAQTLIAVGALIRSASFADMQLRVLYCALAGRPEAAADVGGQMTNRLICECIKQAENHSGITTSQQKEVLEYLSKIKQLADQRNRVVHDVWASSSEGHKLIRSSRGTHRLSSQPITVSDLVECSQGFTAHGLLLMTWAIAALGPHAASMEMQLRWQEERSQTHSDKLDHDHGPDPAGTATS